MIICYSQGFLFIKTRKTAGSSLEIALSRVCNDRDVVTPLHEKYEEEAFRKREGGHPPCNYKKPLLAHRTIRSWRRLLGRRGREDLFHEHSTAEQIRSVIGDETWRKLYKFTVERNPWDRAVSRYYWEKQRRQAEFEKTWKVPYPGISDCLRYYAEQKPNWLSNWYHYAIDGEIVVDKVLFYESLSQDLDSMKRELGITGDISLPKKRAKSGYRADRHYSEVLSEADRNLIAQVCHQEIEAFGYEFESAAAEKHRGARQERAPAASKDSAAEQGPRVTLPR